MWRRGLPFAAFFLVLILTRTVWAQDSYVYVPLTTPNTSTSWDGDAKNGTTDNAVIDLSSVFNVPEGVKAVNVRLFFRDETVGVQAGLRPASSGSLSAAQYTSVANQNMELFGTIPCDANGDVYFYSNGELDSVNIQIWGYYTSTVVSATVTPVPTDTPAPTHTLVPTDTPQPTHTLVPTNTPEPTATYGWYVLTLTPPSGGGSSYDPDPFHTVVTQTLSTGHQWAFVREIDTGEIAMGALGLAIGALLIFRLVVRR